MKNKRRKGYAGYLYILPWVIGFFTLQLVPLINSFAYSFTSFSILGSPKFIGLENYRKILNPILHTGDEIQSQLKVTIVL